MIEAQTNGLKTKVKPGSDPTKSQIIKHLKKFNKWDPVDMPLVEQAVSVLEQMREARQEIEIHGAVYVSPKTGHSSMSGYVQVYLGLCKQYYQLSAKLGLSPRAREKWKVAHIARDRSHLFK